MGTLLVLDETAFVVLLNVRHWLQVLCDHQKAECVAWVHAILLVRCHIRQDGRLIPKPNALKLSNLASNVTTIVCRDLSFPVVVRSFMIYSIAFGNEHDALFLAAPDGGLCG